MHELRSYIPALISHLVRYGQYDDQFKSIFLDHTRDYYSAESVHYSELFEKDAQKFLAHCSARREEERLRASAVLPHWTQLEVIDATDKALLTNRLEWLAQNGMLNIRRVSF